MTDEDTRHIQTQLTPWQACLFSRLVVNHRAKDNEKSLLCISANHPQAKLHLSSAPYLVAGQNHFYDLNVIERVEWQSCTNDKATLTRDAHGIFMEYIGHNTQPTSYYSHLVRVKPELDPAMAVRIRILAGINKLVKSLKTRKRRRQLAFLSVRNAPTPENAFAGMPLLVQEELTHLPPTILQEGLLRLKEQLASKHH